MRLVYTILISLAFQFVLQGQKLASFEPIGSYSKGIINFLDANIRATYDVDLYKVRYYTADALGEQHIASGLVVLPTGDSDIYFPITCYQHGTVGGREDVPSNQMGGFQLALAFAGRGYAVCAADFVGLGDSPGIHPYVHAATEASAGVDLMYALREMAEQLPDLNLNDQVFVSGYSQGGHAAMAVHRAIELEHSADFTVTAAAPMSGPYSVSERMVDFTLGDNEYQTVAYLSWLVLGYQTAYPSELAEYSIENVFKEEYVADINEFAAETIDLWTLNDRMIATLINTVGTVTPKNTLKPEILAALTDDPTHPLSVALADNDTYDWAPQSPTRLYYCEGDDQVTYENAILAEEVMTANGAEDLEALRMDTDSNPLDHGGCVFPATLNALDWFDTFQILSSTSDFETETEVQTYYYDNKLRIELTNGLIRDGLMCIHDMSGRLLISNSMTDTTQEVDLSGLSNGFYVLTISESNQLIKSTKVFKF